MAITKLKRKKLRIRARAKQRKQVLKHFMKKPVLRKADTTAVAGHVM